MSDTIEINISLKSVIKLYIAIFALVLFFHVLALFVKHGLGYASAKGLVPLFLLDFESNVPTLFSVFLFLQISVICMAIGFNRTNGRGYWLILCLLFALFALDEFASLHKIINEPVHIALSTSGFFYFAWIIPYGVFTLIIGIIFTPWLIKLPRLTRSGFLVSATIYIFGVLVLEGMGGWYLEGKTGQHDIVYDLIITAEESCELIGLLIFFYFSVDYLITNTGVRRIQLKK